MARDLNIRITADNSNAEAKLAQTENSIKRLAKVDPETVAIFDKIKKGQEDVGKAAQEAEPELNKSAIAYGKLAGAAAGFAAVKGVQAALDLAGRLSDLSTATGLSVEFLQRLNIVAQQNGTTMEVAARGVFALQKAAVEGKISLDGLGVTQAQIIAMKPEELYTRFAKSMAEIENPTIRNTTAMKALKGTADDLLPVMLANMEKATQGAIIWSQEQVASMDKAGDSWVKFKLGITMVFGEVTSAFLRGWELQLQKLGQWTGAVISAGATVVKTFIDMKNSVLASVQSTFEGVKSWMGDRLASVSSTVKGVTDSVSGWFADMYKKVVGGSYVPDMVIEVGEWFGRLPSVMVNPTVDATSKVAGLFGSLANAVGGAAGSILNSVASAISGIQQLVGIIQGLSGANAAASGVASVAGMFGGVGSAASTGMGIAGMAGTIGTIGTIAAISGATLGIGLAAYGIYKGVQAMQNPGRDMVVDFAGSVGGFDRLHARLLAGGDEGEAMWVRLTQGVGSKDERGARDAINDTINMLTIIGARNPTAAPAPGPSPAAGFDDEDGIRHTHGGFPIMDVSVRRVTKPGYALVKPGDEVGMPGLGGGRGTTVIVNAQGSFFRDRTSLRELAELIAPQLPLAVRRYGVG